MELLKEWDMSGPSDLPSDQLYGSVSSLTYLKKRSIIWSFFYLILKSQQKANVPPTWTGVSEQKLV